MNRPSIVIAGSILDTGESGGLEFFGPYDSLEEAEEAREKIKSESGEVCLAVELLRPR